MSATQPLAARDFKSALRPIWCPGCGDFGVLAALERALATLARPPHETAIVSGIGCSSRLPAYTSAYGFHGVHGRALPIATGLKLARPDIEVIVVSGDGDAYSIGGNHFLHACRRNLDMLLIVMDNRTYGMTIGQPSPTTEEGWRGPLALHGSGIRPINPLALAIASGANFVARGFAGDPNTLARMIVEGIRWPGFAFIEVLSPCVTFRPDQIAWKAKVRRALESPFFDIPAASKALLEDDGFGLGIWFQRELGQGPTPRQVSATVTEIEKELLR